MAKVIVLNNVFDIEDSEEYELNEEKSVKDFLYENKLEEIDYSCCVEIYDPETGETSYQTIEDDTDNMLVNIVVNGKVESPDYIIQKADKVIINILPASGMTEGQKGGLWEGLFGLAFLALGVAAIVASGGVAAVAFGGAFMGSAIAVNYGALGLGLLSASIGIYMMLDGGKKLFGNNKDKSIKDDTGEKNPSVNGSQNQPLGENAFPLVIGNNHVTPYIVGSPYNEYEYSPTMDKSWFGNKQKMYMLLGVGYGPLYIEDIRLDQLPIAQNKQNVLSGILSSEREGEIGESWKNNKPKFEISQFGQHRTIYQNTVKQKQIGATLLYCYDNMYSEIATEKSITWQGGTFPTGMRTNSVYFTESVPYKIAVGIKFPNGLYRTNGYSSGDNIRYTKIPMNLVVQWRPYYKYVKVNELDTKPLSSDTYSREEGYTEGRYGNWRNFDDSTIVPKITYSCGEGNNKIYKNYLEKYILTSESQVFVKDGYLGYYSVSAPAKVEFDSGKKSYYYENSARDKVYIDILKEGAFCPVQKYKTEQDCYDILYDAFCFANGNKEYGFNAATIDGVKYKSYYQTSHTGVKSGRTETRTTYLSTASKYANYYKKTLYNKQITDFKAAHPDGFSDYELNVGSREVALNLGLTDGTSSDCNPDWSGVTAFSFGKCSGGHNMYNKADPSLTSEEVWQNNVEDAKDEMDFELTATLNQEDILDLINRNPMSQRVGYVDDVEETPSDSLKGNTEVVFDSIQVRVIRLTPCYIDKTLNSISYTYEDVVQWSYLKSYCIDKTKLLRDIDNTEYGKTFPKIYCDKDTFDKHGDVEVTVPDEDNPENTKGVKKTVNIDTVMESEGTKRWNEWDISDYYSKPLNDTDTNNLVTIGIEIQPDKLGYISNSIDKINLTAKAIMPAYKFDTMNGKSGGYTRYVKKSDDVYYFCDRYDSESDILNLDTVAGNKLVWQFCGPDSANSDEYDDIIGSVRIDIGTRSGFEYSYYTKNNAWDNIFFPKKIETTYTNQLVTDVNGNAVYEDDGHTPKVEKVKSGNDWFDYIKNEMSIKIDEYGRWIATTSFKNTFCDQNAISNALGFMTGKSLGKDAYVFNSYNSNKLVRVWRVKDDEYYCYDTELEEAVKSDEWQYVISEFKEAKEQNYKVFLEESPTEIEYTDSEFEGWTWYYSLRKVKSDFNPLALRESIEYTDNIDIGGNAGSLKYCCNLYIYQQQKVVQILSTILTAGRAYWFYDENGRYEIHNDKPLKNPVLLVTDENVIQFSNTRAFSKMIAGYHITYNDENNDGQQGEIYVLREGQTKENHTRDIKDISLTGITNGSQAWAMGAYLLGQSITQRESWNIKLNHVGGALTIGSLIEVQSKSLQIGTDTSGRIVRLIEDGDYIYGFILDSMYKYRGEYNDDGSNVQGCTIMQSIQSDESRVVTVRFANRTQQEEGITVRYQGVDIVYKNSVGTTNCVLFEKKIVKETSKQYGQVPDEETGVTSLSTFTPKPGDVIAFGNVGSITSKAVVTAISFDDKQNVTISTYPYFDSLYTSGSKLPVYQANVTKKPIIDSMPTNTESYKVISEAVEANNEAINEKISTIDVSTFTVTPSSQMLSCDYEGNLLDEETEVIFECALYEKGVLFENPEITFTINDDPESTTVTTNTHIVINKANGLLKFLEKNNLNIISFTAEGDSVTRTASVSVSKGYAGEDGTYPIQYDLQLDTNSVHIEKDRSIHPAVINPVKMRGIDGVFVPTDYGNVFVSKNGGEEFKVGTTGKDTSGVFNDSAIYQAQYTPLKLKIGETENGDDVYLTEDSTTTIVSMLFERTNN